MDAVEHMLINKRRENRRQSVQVIKDYSRPEKEYATKVNFIDKNVNKQIKYFAKKRKWSIEDCSQPKLKKLQMIKQKENKNLVHTLHNFCDGRQLLRQYQVQEINALKSCIEVNKRLTEQTERTLNRHKAKLSHIKLILGKKKTTWVDTGVYYKRVTFTPEKKEESSKLNSHEQLMFERSQVLGEKDDSENLSDPYGEEQIYIAKNKKD